MLLTSAGIKNGVLKSALADLLGVRFPRAKLVFIPTASVAHAGDHRWVVKDLNRLRLMRWRELNMLELNGLPAQVVRDRLRNADVVYVEGGNHYHLANSFIRTGLDQDLAEILDTKVYVGASAGSMIFSRPLSRPTGEAFGEENDLRILGDAQPRSPLGLFDWYLKPHLNSRGFDPARTPAWFRGNAAKVDFPVYALDDQSAVRVRGDEVDVVSGGKWLLLNAPAAGAGQQRPGRLLGRA
jgi:dipeptidase E